mmetsp:Transcript_34350/g.96843  ORF Transcript_34350/g.96843 Transcript_34350/m.96843 type:complete len:297 (+) Transcript_34350:45-935(+)|eukprot:CAMPEP_0119130840 /NCGR_PEP_ID=MMETSP1310-20130426/8955_1 /TAXON_ID=464262 /ORGANISM="Genus nov. species nov., Strain RCC2339" /LENGTH=296 /DNA_ID=CAMNT_0007121379 /DNA_START=54 /DNA_END=944 /DNA_ORIENTATION=+
MPGPADVAAYVQQNKVKIVLAAVIAVFWLIGFGFYCAKLDNVVYSGNPFMTEIKTLASDGEFVQRPYPGFLFCVRPGTQLGALECKQCGISFGGDGEEPDFCTKPAILSSEFDPKHGCYIVNQEMENVPDGPSYVNCDVDFNGTGAAPSARMYLYNQDWPHGDSGDGSHKGPPPRLFPNGLVQRSIQPGTRNLVEISRNLYKFLNHGTIVGYELMDGETYPVDGEATHSSVTVYYGNYVEFLYTETSGITTHYDFWYWIGFCGGLGFVCYAIHSAVYMVISFALGLNNDGYSNVEY